MLNPSIREKAIRDTYSNSKHKKIIRKYEGYDLEDLINYSLNWIIDFKPAKHTPIRINDGISRKQRFIIVPTFEELVVQHCVVLTLMPMFMHGMYEHSYASIPGRGSHLAKKYIKKWIEHDKKNVKYILKMDIHHFFDSISHEVIKNKFESKIHDKRMLDLIFKIIDTTESGLPLGFYTSQWFANWYLEELDHYIKEDLQSAHYVRYMDDMVIFGSNKRDLHLKREFISEFLKSKLNLDLKDNWQVFRFDYIKNGRHYGRDLDFMGFRFFRDKIIMRKSIMLKASRKALRINKKQNETIYDIRQFLSYLGWLDDTDTYDMYKKYVKPKINVQQMKRKISWYDKNAKNKRKEVYVSWP